MYYFVTILFEKVEKYDTEVLNSLLLSHRIGTVKVSKLGLYNSPQVSRLKCLKGLIVENWVVFYLLLFSR